MKAVLLLAGRGCRMQGKFRDIHKSLIPLCGKPLLAYLVRNIELVGFSEIVPVLGYKAEDVLKCIDESNKHLKIIPVYNHEYDKTNNLYSLLCAEKELNDEFVVCNGDMVFDYRILEKISKDSGSRIAIYNLHSDQFIDSPRVIIDGKILDLGRHIKWDSGDGYAIGIYKFGYDIAEDFFKEGHKLCDEDSSHGFHDPLRGLFESHTILPTFVNSFLWTDIDEESDVEKAESYLRSLKNDCGRV